MNAEERREAVRRSYDYSCGYCSVREEEVGSTLEIDHFQPRSVSGSNELSNLVYCCTTCNRFKGDFWRADDPSTTTRRLLHPKQDNLAIHIRTEKDGQLTGLTKIGAFHIQRLKLNRPPLVALRRARQEKITLRQDLLAAQQEQARLQERISSLEDKLEGVLSQLARLLG